MNRARKQLMHGPRRDLETPSITLEYRHGAKTVAQFRAMLLKLAYRLIRSEKRGVIFLDEPALSPERIEREWEQAEQTLRARSLDRITIVCRKEGDLRGWPEDPDPEVVDLIVSIERSAATGHRLTRPDAPSVILRILVDRWFAGNEPITSARLGELSGFSYPTVANALERFADVIQRTSDRRVQLSYFPEQHWTALVMNADQVRSTLRFRDQSGTRLSPEHMLSRIDWRQKPALGVGGVRAARVIYPKLDLIGEPRIDLCVHAPDNVVDLDFVELMNPALKRSDRPSGPCDLALHFVRSADPMYITTGYDENLGPPLASPAEVLLDLHEMGLTRQAEELRSFLERKHA